MKILLLLFILHPVFGGDGFGSSYMYREPSCRPWVCINTKLGLENSLPPREQFREVLKGLLPETWQGFVDATLDGCYGNRSRSYAIACPGQSLIECTVDQLIKNCPESYLRKNDACSPVSSPHGLEYMFSQRLYENLEANLAYEQRPALLRNKFNTKCCNLPELFNTSLLTECGFERMMHYERQEPPVHVVTQTPETFGTTESASSGDYVHVVDLPPRPVEDVDDVFGGDGFGSSYRYREEICRGWICINTKLGLENSLPPREQFREVLKGLLPGTWHDLVEATLDGCYGNRSRSYTIACPGQSLIECTVDQLIKNCPESYLRKNDACSPVASPLGYKYIFSQGLYVNMEANLAYEKRPAWILRHHLNTTCCNLPELFNTSLLTECGFERLLYYDRYEPHVHVVTQTPETFGTTESASSGDYVHVVDLPPRPVEDVDDTDDPLQCCDLSGFIQPSWRSDCDFKLKWDLNNRLTIDEPSATTTAAPTTTTTAKPRLDVKVLPLSCAQETCVFRKLNIVSESGSVDMDAFSKLLNNLTTVHPLWAKAKARVVTKCLTRQLFDYKEDCEINKVLACTFDVLSENCPTAKKNDPCKHSSTVPADVVCQISSAKFVPKYRHQYCEVPSLVKNDILQECGITSLNRLEYSTHAVPVTSRRVPDPMCTKLTGSTTCLLSKMGVLNKYQFMDNFKMKASIRDFTSTQSEWLALNDAYLSAFTTMPMYRHYCASPKKLLNLLDVMLMTCPLSKRKSSPKCYKMFNEMSRSPMQNQNPTKQQMEELLHQFQKIFIPVPPQQNTLQNTHKVTGKMYDFGILDDGNAPKVRVIDVNPTIRPIKVLVPVYQQIYGYLGGDMTVNGLHKDSVLRGGIGRG